MFSSIAYDLSWRMIHVHLKRMCILMLLDRMFLIYLVYLI